MRSKLALTNEDARLIAAGARAEAERNGWAVTIAVLDDGGHLLYLERLDGARPPTATIAAEKGRTAALFGRPTKGFEETVAGGRAVIMSMPHVLPVEGGVPVIHGGEVLGAVGVSGVKSPEDAQVAAAGIAAWSAALS